MSDIKITNTFLLNHYFVKEQLFLIPPHSTSPHDPYGLYSKNKVCFIFLYSELFLGLTVKKSRHCIGEFPTFKPSNLDSMQKSMEGIKGLSGPARIKNITHFLRLPLMDVSKYKCNFPHINSNTSYRSFIIQKRHSKFSHKVKTT